jgi:hypothetical protein
MRKESGVFSVATFHSTYSVLKAEKIFKEAGLAKVRLVPVPSQISSDCGITVRFLQGDMKRARELLTALSNDLEGIYTQTGKEWETIFETED